MERVLTTGQMNKLAAMVRKETIANTIATAIVAALLTWVIFRGHSPLVPLAPPVGGIYGIVPGTFNFTLAVTIGMTLVTRRRMRGGLYERRAERDGRLGDALPANVVVRAIGLALLATLVFVPLTIGLVRLALHEGWIAQAWSFTGMLAFFIAYFALLSWVVTPIILWRALRD